MRTGIRRGLTAIFSVMTLVFLCLILASGFASLSALRQLSQTNYDSSGHAAVQLRLHYNLLLSELRILESGHAESSLDSAKLQYDIVYQRLQSLPNRPPYSIFLTKEELSKVQEIFSLFAKEADRFDAATETDFSSLNGVKERLMPFSEQINKLSGRIIQLAGEYRGERRKQIVRSTYFLVMSIFGLVITGGGFAFLYWRSLKHLQKQNRYLEVTSQKLVEANRAKSEFLALMSHELRTPLNAIIGFSDMISHEAVGDIGNKKYIEYSNDIKHSGDHLLHLINDILDLSKIEAGKYRLEPSYFNLQQAVADIIRIVSLASRSGSVRIHSQIGDDFGNLYTDHRSLRQILINIISNADKYTPIDGRVDVWADKNPDGSIDIHVKDNGIGIAEDDIDHVLEPFGQSRQDSSLTHEGTGLGLPISKRLMALNGGTLELVSEFGVGTEVILHFPNKPTSD